VSSHVGGVARYTRNLVKALRNIEAHDVYVVCNEEGDGDLLGPDAFNGHNSDVLLQLFNKIHPDIVHVQYEYARMV
jgi:glycosyltransferase involved in cell wall biosynthesis